MPALELGWARVLGTTGVTLPPSRLNPPLPRDGGSSSSLILAKGGLGATEGVVKISDGKWTLAVGLADHGEVGPEQKAQGQLSKENGAKTHWEFARSVLRFGPNFP